MKNTSKRVEDRIRPKETETHREFNKTRKAEIKRNHTRKTEPVPDRR